MKRIVLFAALVALIAAPAAQAQIGFGVNASGGLAMYTGLDENFQETDEFAPGFAVGGTVTYDLTGALAELVEVEKFLLRGNVDYMVYTPADDEFDVLGTTYTISYSMSAISIEVGGLYYINERAYAGLYLAMTPWMLDAEIDPGGFTSSVEGETDFGPILTAGYHLSDGLALEVFAGNSHIRLGAVYLF